MWVFSSYSGRHGRALGALILCLLCLLLFAQMIACANDAGPVTLLAIIENVRENEQLYENLDVTYESNYSTGNRALRTRARQAGNHGRKTHLSRRQSK